MSQTIEITVNPQGQTTVQNKGFSGSSCREASKFLEQALGERTSETLTSEFYASQDVTQQTQLHQ